MTKLVLKTTLITLLSVFMACLIAFGAFALFAPATVARFFDGMGSSSVAVFFYEKQYKKTSDIEDLSVLVIKIEDGEKLERYLGELIARDDFEEFCALQDGEQTGFDSKEYYYGEYVTALDNNGKLTDAIQKAVEYVNDYGYTVFNPLRLLVDNTIAQNTDRITALNNAIGSIIVDLTGESQTYANQDLTALSALIG